MNEKWSDAEKNFIRQNAARLKDEEIAAKLTQIRGTLVTLFAVRQCRLRLGVKKRPGRGVCQVRKPSPPKNSLGFTIKGEAEKRGDEVS